VQNKFDQNIIITARVASVNTSCLFCGNILYFI